MVGRGHRKSQWFYYIYQLEDGQPDKRLGGYYVKADADNYAAMMNEEESSPHIKFVVRHEAQEPQ